MDRTSCVKVEEKIEAMRLAVGNKFVEIETKTVDMTLIGWIVVSIQSDCGLAVLRPS